MTAALRLALALLLSSGFSAAGFADAKAGTTARGYYRSSELDSKPVPLATVDPKAPKSVTSAGRVRARVLINETGRVDRVLIVSSEPPGVFDVAVVGAFGSVRYRPGVKAGFKVKSQLLVDVAFEKPQLRINRKPGAAR